MDGTDQGKGIRHPLRPDICPEIEARGLSLEDVTLGPPEVGRILGPKGTRPNLDRGTLAGPLADSLTRVILLKRERADQSPGVADIRLAGPVLATGGCTILKWRMVLIAGGVTILKRRSTVPSATPQQSTMSSSAKSTPSTAVGSAASVMVVITLQMSAKVEWSLSPLGLVNPTL